ncbi:class I SAM-dependent methyltransferase [Bacillus aquiflavi]|uniref:Class I SAM-dependent methyltransferase n=1 Tax=Bacillus aquiflavi TaxID=2672567 RepID=A0A6B3VVG2_9BACI|nr:class I SAM-dependent methyltransferase [Bacillus aquiflavi]MBA4535900.1 class I SAM-dependent methyltransferase [Bacillus aquiflavi]NEY80275.1 class I SAM-dependent methyltransferase [Bacillus aquiflavi]UAC47317.1 class I SAM-dependent methyltransferase [Bacillus aquiflavi]
MTYEHFAYLYDHLMKDVPYDKWVDFTRSKIAKYHVQGKKLLDLACGTGELSVRMAHAGYEVTGVDLSSNMLTIAQEKAKKECADISFFQQNMAELEGLDHFDVIVVFCDSLNYLEEECDVLNTFKRVYDHLNDHGLFIFDVHSIYKLTNIFMNNTFGLNDEDISYVWHCYQGEHTNSVEHELTFFVLDERTGQYKRFDELHMQRIFAVEQYEIWLKEAGFKLLEINSDFGDNHYKKNAERLFFTAIKSY